MIWWNLHDFAIWWKSQNWKFWWLGILQDFVEFQDLVDYFGYFLIFVIGNYLVGFLSARHLVEIPELENLNLGILVVRNLGGWKFWWFEILVVEIHLVDFQNFQIWWFSVTKISQLRV